MLILVYCIWSILLRVVPIISVGRGGRKIIKNSIIQLTLEFLEEKKHFKLICALKEIGLLLQ